jgi:hypothetical protein
MPTKISRPPQQQLVTGGLSGSQPKSKASIQLMASGLNERKRSVGRPGKISPLKEQYADKSSPYVSQETAAILKKHLARRGINNNGAPI